MEMLYKPEDVSVDVCVVMYALPAKYWHVMLCLVAFAAVAPTAGLPAIDARSVAGITLSMYTKLNQTSSVLGAAKIDEIQDFFGEEVAAACGDMDCELTQAKVILTVGTVGTEAIDGGYKFGIEINIVLPDTSHTMAVKRSLRLTRSSIEALLLNGSVPGFSLLAYSDTYRMDADRSAVCGDGILHPSEVCDDGNIAVGDGCTGSCRLEPGYTCFGAWRDPFLDPSARGKMTLWVTDFDNVTKLTILATDELCLGGDIDEQDDRVFDPEMWLRKYFRGLDANDATPPIPPAGYFGKRFCTQTFTAPYQYEFQDSCIPAGIDECSRNASICSLNANCIEPPDKVGYECECDDQYFVGRGKGASCVADGMEMVVHMSGPLANYVSYQEELALMENARSRIMQFMLRDSLILDNNATDETTLLEGVKRYPVALATPSVQTPGPLLNRSLWRIVIRAPQVHMTEPSVATQDSIFHDMETWSLLFNDTVSFGPTLDQHVYKVNAVGTCSNDSVRPCSSAHDLCLQGSQCRATNPDVTITHLPRGGSVARV